MPSFFLFLLAVFIGLITGLLAARKGYSFWLWVLAAGVIGLLVLAFLPFTNGGNMSEKEARSRRRTGNMLGAILSAMRIIQIVVSYWGAIKAALT